MASLCVDCTNYTDEIGEWHSNQSCTDSGQLCCGNCTSRYCCDDISLAFYQNECPVPISTTTDYYWTNDYNHYYNPDPDYLTNVEYVSNVKALIIIVCTIIPIIITICVSVILYVHIKRRQDGSQSINMPIISNQVARTRSHANMGHIRDLLPPIPMHMVNNVNSNTILRTNTLPSYTEIKNESIVNGPFIIRTSDELPKYEEI